MSKEKRRVPKLRFPGFTEDWEQRKLSDILVERNEQQVETNEYPLMSFVQGHGVIPKGERYDRSFLVLDQSKKYKRTELGDFIYSSNNLETGSIGINKTGKAVISPVYSIFYGVSIGDSQFIGIMSLLPRFITKMIRFRQGVVYGQWRIHEKDFLDISILIPSEAERTKITKLILSIEELITLHQRKLDNLKLKKKALLQKLFPKNGERYPELRFPGFTDAWEQRKLGDFYTFKNGLNKEKVYFGYGDSIVNFTDVFHNRQIYSSTLKGKVCVNKKELENYKVKEGDLFFTRTSETIDEIGFPAVVMEPMERVVFSGFVLRGRAEKYDPLVNIFKSYIFFTNNFRSEMKKKSSMTTRALTSGTALKEMYFSYPKDLEEQTKIGEILLRLDKIITLHQRKLDHLQLQKKALLQQMFV
ncbi:restriction endonuclease subunit S [Veillonella parvula]|uniref:restriction endonuclease subunit S n=1 Tax=Veillonella parvula TaxID=29466 RepID=UPI002900FE6C|nr:restriction endonuclease subunit S [Veillonella parvula]MDU3190486.1 restriction endonuclease subunit S [Veillonella parvula]MDU6073172.1 restriction endonuclease subunit S [Veillonella parvula]